MVLYIFHVNTGGMLTFEMEMALQTVQNLKETIERLHGIPSVNQVLLISGGEVLQASSRVCSYSSGTDENPIYMFSTLFDNSNHLTPWPSIESHTHYEDEVNRCLQMPAEYNTVVVRSKVAQKMYESATKEIKVCERLVFEQHLQQQGWAAVMANLEDLTNEFKQRRTDFLNTINDYVEQRPSFLSYLESFQDDLTKLSTVPILSDILPSASDDFHGFDEYFHDNASLAGSAGTGSAGSSNRGGSSSGGGTQSDESSHSETVAAAQTIGRSDAEQPTTDATGAVGGTELESSDQKKQQRSLTLLQWISTKENHRSLQEMAEDCSRVLVHFDDTAIKSIKGTIDQVLRNAEKENVREVRGLTERLEQLDELMRNAKKIVQEQKELSTAFAQNQVRANNLGDASILPDLCMSHSNHLKVMLQNHNKLLDIQKRFMKAKEELAENLCVRLKIVVYIQSSVSDLDSKLLFHHRCFRRLKHHMVIIEQIHHAPTVYVTAVTEVVRRRLFSNGFMKWAADLANHMLTIYDEEVLRRQEFGMLFENHFLNTLFTGLDDMPPSFATIAPVLFDQNLPSLSKSDLDMLKSTIPDIASAIELPDLKEVLKFFARGFSNQSSLDETRVAEIMKIALLKPTLNAHLKDGFESETDTEEFEKLGQSPIDRQSSNDSKIIIEAKVEMSTATDPIEMRDNETLTDDNESNAQAEIKRLKVLLYSMSQLSLNSIALLRDQFRHIGDDVNANRTDFTSEFEKIEKSWSQLREQQSTTERETVNRLTVDHELELNDIRKCLTAKDDEIAALKCDNSKLLEKLANTKLECERVAKQTTDETDTLRTRLEQLQQRVANFECEKEKAVNELKDKMNREYKTEMESLRCRYKLMKNMDRSPSDTSLEKIDRPELIEYERSGGRSTLQASSPKSPTTGQSLYRRILDEKERQIDDLNNQVQVIVKENSELKEAIQSLADYEQPDQMSLEKLQGKIDALQKDKLKLKQKLNTERLRRTESTPATTEISTGDTVSSSSSKSSSANRPRYCSKKCVRLESCENGDTVLIIWNEQLCRYTIAQDSQYIHFLAEDSHPLFNLPVPSTREIIFDNIQKPLHFFGTVADKQYCMVKKEGTRYRVPIGTKFCRIKVKPLPPPSSRHSGSSDQEKSSSKKAIDASASIRSNLPVSRSLSIQMMDSFAQTEVVTGDTKLISSLVDRDMVDSGVVAQLRQSDRISINEDDEGAVSISYDDRYRCVSANEEDEAVIVDNRSSQENSTSDLPDRSIGFFTLIEPLITPIQLFLDK